MTHEHEHDWRVDPHRILATNPPRWLIVCAICEAEESGPFIGRAVSNDPLTWPKNVAIGHDATSSAPENTAILGREHTQAEIIRRRIFRMVTLAPVREWLDGLLERLFVIMKG